MTDHDYVVLDVFTNTPLQGNPVAIFTDAGDLDATQMQRAARELNLSETVFVTGEGDESETSIRIFTPTTELPFAGHPVLGTAFALGRPGTEIRLKTHAGVVGVQLADDGRYAEMEQPDPVVEAYEREAELLAAVGVARSLLPIEAYTNGPVHTFITLDSAAAVEGLSPDLNALQRLGPINVSCFAQLGETTVKTRMFAPGIGVAEDPATGSAAGPLALHLQRHGHLGSGVTLELHQGQEIGRPSRLFARVEEDGRIKVGGSAVQVARGAYRLT